MLVERDREVATLVALADHATRGDGRLVLIGGDAGVGKTTLVRAGAELVRGRLAVHAGMADNVTTAAGFGPFLDALPELAAVVSAGEAGRFRMLRALREILADGPRLVILEDLHWADEATLDAVRYLGRRLSGLPLLMVATFRAELALGRHPLAVMLGDLAGATGVSRIDLAPLTPKAVAELARQADAEVDVADLHARTGGNPFFVTEVLAAGGEAVPLTVRDAVLGRAAQLSPDARDVLAAAALLGPGCDLGLLTAVADRPAAAVDECVDAAMLLAPDPITGGYVFRHELARQAVEQTLSASSRRELHARALAELARRDPDDHRALAYHAGGCGDHDAVLLHAREAALRAAALGAHREAAALYRTALRVPHLPQQHRLHLVEALAYECYLTDQIEEALTARRQCLELHQLAGEPLGVGANERWLSRLSWFAGRSEDSERYAARAVATLEPLGDSHELGMAYSNRAQLRMLAGDLPDALRWGEQAMALAGRQHDTEVEIHSLNNIGAALVNAGQVAEGEDRLARSLDLALATDAYEHAARAYTNLGAGAAAQFRFGAAERVLQTGIAYCEERDLGSWTRYMSAWEAVTYAETGRHDEALTVATRVLQHPEVAAVSRIPALIAAGSVCARRGQKAPQLEQALSLAREVGELQRVVPATAAAAEAAWLRGQAEQIPSLVDPVWLAVQEQADPWLLGILAWWQVTAGAAPPDPLEVAEPLARMLAGQWAAAASAWEQQGCPVWVAYSLGLDPAENSARRAFAILDELGAAGSADALLRERRERGLSLPRRPRQAARENFGQLTARELEVLRLLGEGLSNSEVADRLVLSPKTVEHHVSAVLRKLGEPNRAKAVAAARRTGVLQDS